jgi:hypothetical protein
VSRKESLAHFPGSGRADRDGVQEYAITMNVYPKRVDKVIEKEEQTIQRLQIDAISERKQSLVTDMVDSTQKLRAFPLGTRDMSYCLWSATPVTQRTSYKKRFQAYPEIVEEIANLLRNKHVQWEIENQTNGKRGDEIEGIINVPVGEATLTVETSDPNLRKDLDDLISKLEKVHDRTLDDHLSHPL